MFLFWNRPRFFQLEFYYHLHAIHLSSAPVNILLRIFCIFHIIPPIILYWCNICRLYQTKSASYLKIRCWFCLVKSTWDRYSAQHSSDIIFCDSLSISTHLDVLALTNMSPGRVECFQLNRLKWFNFSIQSFLVLKNCVNSYDPQKALIVTTV